MNYINIDPLKSCLFLILFLVVLLFYLSLNKDIWFSYFICLVFVSGILALIVYFTRLSRFYLKKLFLNFGFVFLIFLGLNYFIFFNLNYLNLNFLYFNFFRIFFFWILSVLIGFFNFVSFILRFLKGLRKFYLVLLLFYF